MRERGLGYGIQMSGVWEERSLLSWNLQELVQGGLTGRKEEGCSSCEERLQVNLGLGLLVALGERKAAVRKQFKDGIPDCVLKTSRPTQVPLESQVKNCPQLMD